MKTIHRSKVNLLNVRHGMFAAALENAITDGQEWMGCGYSATKARQEALTRLFIRTRRGHLVPEESLEVYEIVE